jgi:hypothetical protein
MITKPTILILGAGASVPYGFPSGRNLKTIILRRLFQDDIIGSYGPMGFEKGIILRFRAEFRQSGVDSIDAFLEHRPEFINLGKNAIAEALIPFEQEQLLFPPVNDWYGYLLNQLNAQHNQFANNRLSILTYNYDRSLEWYLYKALKARFGLNDENALIMIKSIPIIHLHGKLGNLPWEENGRPYHESLDRPEIYMSRDKIKIIHELNPDDAEFQRARHLLSERSQIIFLGFGYNRTNIQRLQPANWANPERVLGTAFDLTALDTIKAAKDIDHVVEFGERDWDVLRFLREKVQFEN